MTDAIQNLIETYSGLAAAHPYMPTDCIGEARAELAALRADAAAQARQIAALRDGLGKTLLDRNLRLVPLERLREIEWSGQDRGCPVCGEFNFKKAANRAEMDAAHLADCWLSAAIAGKETEPLTRDTIR